MKTWLNSNKVFIFGLLSAIAVVVQQYIDQASPDYKVLTLAVVAAGGSYFAKNLRGQWASIAGIAGNMLLLILQHLQDHTPISWFQVGGQALLGFIAVVAPPPKSVTYEHTDVIVAAKQEAQQMDIAKGTVPPPAVAKPE